MSVENKALRYMMHNIIPTRETGVEIEVNRNATKKDKKNTEDDYFQSSENQESIFDYGKEKKHHRKSTHINFGAVKETKSSKKNRKHTQDSMYKDNTVNSTSSIDSGNCSGGGGGGDKGDKLSNVITSAFNQMKNENEARISLLS